MQAYLFPHHVLDLSVFPQTPPHLLQALPSPQAPAICSLWSLESCYNFSDFSFPLNPWISNVFFFFFKLYITVLVLPNNKMNQPQVYMCSPSEPSSILPPHTIPLGHSYQTVKGSPEQKRKTSGCSHPPMPPPPCRGKGPPLGVSRKIGRASCRERV